MVGLLTLLAMLGAACAGSEPAERWTHQFGSLGEDRAFSVAVDEGGNVYVAGSAFLRKYVPPNEEP